MSSTSAIRGRPSSRPGSRAFRSVDDEPEVVTYPGLLVMRIDANLYFANGADPR